MLDFVMNIKNIKSNTKPNKYPIFKNSLYSALLISTSIFAVSKSSEVKAQTFYQYSGVVSWGALLPPTTSSPVYSNPTAVEIGLGGVGDFKILSGAMANINLLRIGDITGGHGTVTVDGGTLTANQIISGYLARGELSLKNGAGILVTTSQSYIAERAGSTGFMSIESGSTFRSSNNLVLGVLNGAVAEVSVFGTNSKLEMTGAGGLTIGNGGEAKLKISSGGTLISATALTLAKNIGATGQIIIGSDEMAPVIITAGTINAPEIIFGEGNGTLLFNHNGLLGANPNDFMDFSTDISSAAGVSSTSHTINHMAGNTRLSGDNSAFTGIVNVSGGRLAIDSDLGAFAVNVQNSGELLGSGNIAGDVIITNGILSNETGEQLTIVGDVTFNANTNVNVTLDGVSSTTALFDVDGSLNLAGSLNVYDAGGFSTGVYRIFDYTGNRNGEFGAVIGHGSVDTTMLSVQYSVAGQVNLISADDREIIFWDGGDITKHNNGTIDGGSGTWDATNHNWTIADGTQNGRNQPVPSFVVFGATGGNVFVDDNVGAISAAGMQFTVDGYAISGSPITLAGGTESIIKVGANAAGDNALFTTISAALAGDTTLVKRGAGTLTLSGNNSFTGGTHIHEGTLQVSQDSNLGAATGDIVLDGARLAVSESFASNRAVQLATGGAITVAADKEFTINGAIDGSGPLLVDGAGTLVLKGSNNYTGGTSITAGTLAGNSTSLQGNMNNNGTLIFNQDNDGVYTGIVSGTGKLIKNGNGTLVLAGPNSYSGGTTISSGTLAGNTAALRGNITNNGTLHFVQAVDGTYAGSMTGNGELIKDGDGSLSIRGDSSAFAGTSTINRGMFFIDQANRGKLGGSLTIGADAVHQISDGTKAVTLTINGDYTNHGTLLVHGTPDGADKIIAEGAVDISGAKLDLVLSPAESALWQAVNGPYTLIEKQSAGSVVGTFASPVTKDLIFLETKIAYNGGASGRDVTLMLERNSTSFADIAKTQNQKAAAAAIESLGQNSLLWRSITASTDENVVRQSFDATSGEAHATTRSHALEAHNQLYGVINNRIRASFDASSVYSNMLTVMAYGPDAKPIEVAADHAGPAFWADAFGIWGNTRGNGNTSDTRTSSGGLLAGVDAELGGVRLGVLGGYSQSQITVSERASSSRVRDIHAGVYAGTELGNIALRATGGYTWHDISTQRHVSIAGLNEYLAANYNGGTAHGFGEVAYKLDLGGVRVEPFANLAHVSTRTNSFTETGGATALTGTGHTTSTTFTTLGLRAQHSITSHGLDAKLTGMVGWRHAFGNVEANGTHAFGSSSTFEVVGSAIARDSAMFEAGFDFKLAPAATLGISYTGQISNKAQMHGVRAGFNVKF